MTELAETLHHLRTILRDLEQGAAHGAREIRAHADLLARATKVDHPQAGDDDELLRLAQGLREKAIETWRRHKVLQGAVHAMID